MEGLSVSRPTLEDVYLRTAVSVALYTDFASIVLWGPELIQIYNDRYRVLMGDKHPRGLGQGNRECWPEAWHINEHIYPRIFNGETISGFEICCCSFEIFDW